jgi:DNA-binding NtrC family response regulator
MMMPQRAILVVDDEDQIRKSFTKLLTRLEYSCATAVNAKEARAALKARPFDVVWITQALDD